MKVFPGIFRTILLLMLVLQASVAFTAGAPPEIDHDVDFRWAFAAMDTPANGKATLQPITQDMALNSGDQLKMMVELERRCFVYVFHYNRQDGLKLIFPYTLQQFGSDYDVHHKYYIPRGDAWFKLDKNAGQEVFYLLASAKRLEELEQAYSRYESAPAPEKPEGVKAVLDMIRMLRREHRELTSPAERPVPIGGALRGVVPVEEPGRFDIATMADEVVSSGFVARTFTIEHK